MCSTHLGEAQRPFCTRPLRGTSLSHPMSKRHVECAGPTNEVKKWWLSSASQMLENYHPVGFHSNPKKHILFNCWKCHWPANETLVCKIGIGVKTYSTAWHISRNRVRQPLNIEPMSKVFCMFFYMFFYMSFIQSNLQLIRLSSLMEQCGVKGLAQGPNSCAYPHLGSNHRPSGPSQVA